jgi:hypothetical protein
LYTSPVALHAGNELKISFLLSKYFSCTQNKSEQWAIELIFFQTYFIISNSAAHFKQLF